MALARKLIAVSLVSLLASAAAAIDAPRPPTASAHYLALSSGCIVLAEPLEQPDGSLPTKYRVQEVLRLEPSPFGHPIDPNASRPVRLQPGQTLELKPKKRYLIKPTAKFVTYEKHQATLNEGPNQPPAKAKQALLFLEWRYDSAWHLHDAGVRLRTEGGAVLIPWNHSYPNKEDPYHLMPLRGVTWDALLRQVRGDIQGADKLLTLRRTPDAGARNAALLGWIEKHADEFDGSGAKWIIDMDSNYGWSHFEREVTRWIFQTQRAEDCWSVIELGDRLKMFAAGSDGGTDPFHSPQGRALLLSKLSDPGTSLSLRTQAMRELARAFWRGTRDAPQRDPSLAERRRIVRGIAPLLDHQDFTLRGEALHGLEKVAVPYASKRDQRPLMPEAIEPLIGRFQRETDRNLRGAIVRALVELLHERQWRQLSGNPQRMAVMMRNYTGRGQWVIGMDLYLGGAEEVKLREPVEFTFKCRRLVDGKVVETRQLPARLDDGQRAAEKLPVWAKYGRLLVQVPLDQLGKGTWRLRANGVLASGDPWTSDALTLKLPPR